MEKAEKEAQEARQAVKTQQQAVDQAQNELNLVQASQEEKQKNYDYAFAKVKALGGNTSATAESAATHQTQAEAALAQADYNQKQQEEVTAKTEYKNARNIVNTLEAALADAKDTQAEAQSKEERAKALSYDTAFLNQITDPDFTYLNDEISKVKDAQSREALLQKAYDAAKQKAAESEEAYGQAKLENVRTLAELAVAQTTYDKYLAEQKAQEAAAQAKADEESRKETEKIRQVFEQKDAVDKYDNSKISQKAMSVKTGDKANAGGMLAAAGVAGMIAALAQKIKRREQD